MTTMTSTSESALDVKWLVPIAITLISTLVSALLVWGASQTRLGLVEASALDHSRRIEIIEVQTTETLQTLARVQALLDRVERQLERMESLSHTGK